MEAQRGRAGPSSLLDRALAGSAFPPMPTGPSRTRVRASEAPATPGILGPLVPDLRRGGRSRLPSRGSRNPILLRCGCWPCRLRDPGSTAGAAKPFVFAGSRGRFMKRWSLRATFITRSSPPSRRSEATVGRVRIITPRIGVDRLIAGCGGCKASRPLRAGAGAALLAVPTRDLSSCQPFGPAVSAAPAPFHAPDALTREGLSLPGARALRLHLRQDQPGSFLGYR